MLLGCSKDEHFSYFHSSCQLGLKRKRSLTLVYLIFLYKKNIHSYLRNALKLFHSALKKILQVVVFFGNIYIFPYSMAKNIQLLTSRFRTKFCSSSKHTWPWNFHLNWGRTKPLLLGPDKYPMASSALKLIKNSCKTFIQATGYLIAKWTK